MYRIDTKSNNVVKLKERMFSELKLREREHLQEWIAKNPEMLGEDLLIIQKEYDGFNDTRERLDLLALDKNGGLVIIENKLDDSGRDVVWQALKYASYCSTLSTKQVVRIYQEYLDQNGFEEDAKENILEFLQREEEELVLNDKDQRIMFVANEYRKEVTSTVLWLLNHDINLQCFRATPYSMNEDVFLQVEQIIPIPETEQFIIDAKEKAKEDSGVSKKVAEGRSLLVKFWSLLKRDLEANNCHYLDNVSAKPYYYISFAKGAGQFGYNIGRKAFRVELYIGRDEDKALINALELYKDEINRKCYNAVTFERLEGKKASRVKYTLNEDEFNPEGHKWNTEIYWDNLIESYRVAMITFYTVVYPYWEKVQKELS